MNKTKNADSKEFVFTFMDILTAPIITFDASWADTIPERVRKLITMQRIIVSITKENTATLAETVAYMMTRTFIGPMTSEWTDIYTHISCKLCEQEFGEDHWDAVQAPRKLDQYKQYKLEQLQRFIYDKRQLVVKKKMTGAALAKSLTQKFKFDEAA